MKNFKTSKGFTLIELMVSVSLFAILVAVSIGSLVTIYNSNRKAENMQIAMDNLNLVIEKMSRNIKFGKYYYCSSGTPTYYSEEDAENRDVSDCASGRDSFYFYNDDDELVGYRLNNGVIEESVESDTVSQPFTPLTSDQINIDNLSFFALGALNGDNQQPRVSIVISGTVGEDQKEESEFNIQTSVSQRELDS